MEIKKEIEGCCTLCYKSLFKDCLSQSVVVDGGVLEIFRYLVSKLDANALIDSSICTCCLSKVHEVYNFKLKICEGENCITSEKSEVKEELELKCRICRDDVDENSCVCMLELLEENNIKEIIWYLIPKSNFQNVENRLVCDKCKNCILTFSEILTLLSVYEQMCCDDSSDECEEIGKKPFVKVEITEETSVDDIIQVHSPLVNSEIIVKEETEEEILYEPQAGCSKDSSEVTLEQFQCKNEEVDLKVENEEDSLSTRPMMQTENKAKSKPLMIRTNNGVYKCYSCQYETKDRLECNRHSLNHGQSMSKEISNPIVIINSKYKNTSTNENSNQSKRHKTSLERTTNNEFSYKPSNVEKQIFKCENCEFQTKFYSNLKIHTLLHGNNDPELKCRICKIQFKSKDEFIFHYKTHGILIHKCLFCDFICNLPSTVDNHLNTHHKHEKVYRCSDCYFQASILDDFLDHRSCCEIRRISKIYSCSHCGFRTASPTVLMKHEYLHEKPLKCAYCNYRTNSESTLKSHTFSTHLSSNRCIYCNIQCDSHKDLIQHIDENHALYKCHICSFTCVKKSILKEHSNIHPENLLWNNTQNVTSKNYLYCASCAYKTLNETLFLKHVKSHNDQMKLKGKSRDFKTFNRALLHRHIGTHKMLIHTCKSCSFQSYDKDTFEVHLQKHRTYKCLLCTFSCKTSEDLDAHSQEHAFTATQNVDIFKCNSCDFQTKFKSNLTVHMVLHKNSVEREILKCPLCRYETKIPFIYKQHLRKHKSPLFKCTIENCPFETTYAQFYKNHMKLHKKTKSVEKNNEELDKILGLLTKNRVVNKYKK